MTNSAWNQVCPIIFSECAVNLSILTNTKFHPTGGPWTWDFLSLLFISSFYLILNNSYSVCVSELKCPLLKAKSHVTFQVGLSNSVLPTEFLWCPLLAFTAMITVCKLSFIYLALCLVALDHMPLTHRLHGFSKEGCLHPHAPSGPGIVFCLREEVTSLLAHTGMGLRVQELSGHCTMDLGLRDSLWDREAGSREWVRVRVSARCLSLTWVWPTENSGNFPFCLATPFWRCPGLTQSVPVQSGRWAALGRPRGESG